MLVTLISAPICILKLYVSVYLSLRGSQSRLCTSQGGHHVQHSVQFSCLGVFSNLPVELKLALLSMTAFLHYSCNFVVWNLEPGLCMYPP